MRVASSIAAAVLAGLCWAGTSWAGAGAPDAAVRLDLATPNLLSDLDLAKPADTADAFAPVVSFDADALPAQVIFGADAAQSALDNFDRTSRFVGATIALASDFHVSAGEQLAQDQHAVLPGQSDLDQLQLVQSAQSGAQRTLLAGAEWDFASWGGLGLVASRAEQSDFGFAPRFSFPGANLSTMVGVSAHLNFGDGWVTSVSYDESRTQVDLRPNQFVVGDNRGFGVSVSKNGLFGDDALGLAVIRPVQPSEAELERASGNYAGLLGTQISLSSATPETDFEMGYETSFDGSITLQANASYQMNVAGQNGNNGIAVLSRAKINF